MIDIARHTIDKHNMVSLERICVDKWTYEVLSKLIIHFRSNISEESLHWFNFKWIHIAYIESNRIESKQNIKISYKQYGFDTGPFRLTYGNFISTTILVLFHRLVELINFPSKICSCQQADCKQLNPNSSPKSFPTRPDKIAPGRNHSISTLFMPCEANCDGVLNVYVKCRIS